MSGQTTLFAAGGTTTLGLPDPITCFSLWQPYAGLVAAGLKPLETRERPWPATRPFPSPLLICATQAMDGDAWHRLRHRIPPEVLPLCELRGVALALVDVVGSRLLTAEDEPRSWYWDPEGDARRGVTRWAWELGNVRRVRPFEVVGGQGFMRKVGRAVVVGALVVAEKGATAR